MKYQVLYSKEAQNAAVVKRDENIVSISIDYRFVDIIIENKLFVPFENIHSILYDTSRWEEGYDLDDDEILFQSDSLDDVVNWLNNNLWLHML